MTDQIDQLLARGDRVGFRTSTHDPEYLGWILIAKLSGDERFLGLVAEKEAPERVQEERHRLEKPYMVLQIELKRSVHEGGGYETEDDYRKKERTWFATLDDVAQQLREWGYDLSDAIGARELDAP